MQTEIEIANQSQTTLESVRAFEKKVKHGCIILIDDGRQVEESVCAFIISSSLIRLGKEMPSNFPLVAIATSGRLKYASIALESVKGKAYLIPAINGTSYPHLKNAFTAIVSGLAHIKPPLGTNSRWLEAQTIHDAIAKAKTTADSLSAILPYGRLYIGSIGSRKTNGGTDYRVVFNGVATEDCKAIIERFVTIKNEQNTAKHGFQLTYLEEVAQFFDAMDRKTWLERQIEIVKDYEATHELRRKYEENEGELPDYRNERFELEIPLEQLLVGDDCYLNGEIKTASDISLEPWWTDFNSMQQMSLLETDVEKILTAYCQEWSSVHLMAVSEANETRFRNWAEHLARKNRIAKSS